MMTETIHPALIFIAGAIILPFIKPRLLKQVMLLIIPLAAFIMILEMHHGVYWEYSFLNYTLIFARVDKLSIIFGYIFIIVSFLAMVYAIQIKEYGQHSAALIYAGATLGVTFAGDLFTLFIFWELMALSSVFLIWYSKNHRALKAGFRYLMVHLIGGCILLGGIIIHVTNTGTTTFDKIEFQGLGPILMMIGFILNAAVPPLNAWLPDAYPEATVTGSIFMTAFTTKSAVYVLARTFPGVEMLVWFGTIMALYGIIFAMIENDIRRLLSYHIISQVGYMVCGIGLGSNMAINGATAHAFCHILYKALLFMGAGAVIHATGKRKMTDLKGNNLYKKMPLCLAFYMIGAFSISAVPLFNGFISKTMVVAAAGHLDRPAIELMLHLASVGTFLSVGLKLPWGTWFGKNKIENSQIETRKTPINMLVAMGLTGFLCIFTGIYPKILYDILPFEVTFHPYTPYSVVAAMQLILFTGLAFWLLKNKLDSKAKISIDSDWFYRRGSIIFMSFNVLLNNFRGAIQGKFITVINNTIRLSHNPVYHLRVLFNKKTRRIEYYDENEYRKPVGVGGTLSLIFFSIIFVLMLLYL